MSDLVIRFNGKAKLLDQNELWKCDICKKGFPFAIKGNRISVTSAVHRRPGLACDNCYEEME